ncbi:MAG: YraN family protein [Vicinamibacteria bacterium]
MAPQALKALADRLSAWRDGRSGESLACRYLAARGFEIVERNFRCRSGEIDVIAREGGTTVFVEVKQRSSERHGLGHEAVTFGKRRRIVRAARLYAAARGLGERPLRFDVVSILDGPSGESQIRHDRGAFDADGR